MTKPHHTYNEQQNSAITKVAVLESTWRKTRRTIATVAICGVAMLTLMNALPAHAASVRAITTPFLYTFNTAGKVEETGSVSVSTSPYWWISSGGKLIIEEGVGKTLSGSLPSGDPWRKAYAKNMPTPTESGTKPQNAFRMFLRAPFEDAAVETYVKRGSDNFKSTSSREPYIGESLIARYKDGKNFYYGGIRADGNVVIKKKSNGTYQTLAVRKVLPGTYNANTNPSLMPKNQWIGLRFSVENSSAGPKLSLHTDIGRTGNWQLALSVVDDAKKYGAPIAGSGLVGIQSDYADAQFENFRVSNPKAPTTVAQQTVAKTETKTVTTKPASSTTSAPKTTVGTSAPVAKTTPAPAPLPAPKPAPAPLPTPAPTPAPAPAPTVGYDALVMKHNPVLYLAMRNGSSGSENDMTGKGHNGTYKGGTPGVATMPNGDKAAVFNGSNQYLTVASKSDLSISTKKALTWEAWIRPDTLEFPNSNGDYVHWMGKCQEHSPTCEWAARMYNNNTSQGRANRFSAYAFNNSAGLGSGSYWQPTAGQIKAGEWVHVVGQYQTGSTPSSCSSSNPGTIDIWVNGVKWKASYPTGCMSQYKISPTGASSPLNIGTMDLDNWFKGAIGKVAIYDRMLTDAEIREHYTAMTGKQPTGSCVAGKCSF